MTYRGNDPTEMRVVANMCSVGANLTSGRIQLLEQVIQILEASVWGNWVRPYIEMLRQVIRILNNLMQLLQRFTAILNRNALQQEAASGLNHRTSPTSGRGNGSPTISPQATSALQNLANLLRQTQQSQQSMQGLLDSLNSQQPTPTATDQAAPGLQPATGTQPAVPSPADGSTPSTQAPTAPAMDGTSGTGGPGAEPVASHGGGGPDGDTATPPAPGHLDGLRTPLGDPPGAGAIQAMTGPGGQVIAESTPIASQVGRFPVEAVGLALGTAGVGALVTKVIGNQTSPGDDGPDVQLGRGTLTT